MRAGWAGLVVTALACAGKGDDRQDDTGLFDPGFGDGGGAGGGAGGGGGGDDTGDCELEVGRVEGVVTGPHTDEPNPEAMVHALAVDGMEELAWVDEEGVYTLDLSPGRWMIFAEAWGCFSMDEEVEVEACERTRLDIRIEDCDIAEKPNLYLYPERPTPMRVVVQHGDRQRITASEPPYRDGWRGLALPDGSFSTGGARAPFLFYELSLTPGQVRGLQREEGWCVPAEGAVDALDALIAAYGFDAAERDDFVEAWRIDLPPATGGTYAVYPQLAVDHLARLDLRPALPVDRLWLLLDDAPACDLPYAPAVVPFDRTGPHAVEWGLVLGDTVH